MPQIEMTPVLIWYAESERGVEARVRLYAGDKAIEEKSVTLNADELETKVKAKGKATWDESDIMDSLGREHDGCVWVKSDKGHKLAKDIRG